MLLNIQMPILLILFVPNVMKNIFHQNLRNLNIHEKVGY